jgi:DNA-binding transcriptional LysR family regulator
VEFGINIIGTSDPDSIFDRLREDPFVLAACKDHPLAAKPSVAWADVEPYHMITAHRSSGNRTLLDAGPWQNSTSSCAGSTK